MATESTGMLIDGVAASEAIDSSGEILDIRGTDISDYTSGVAVVNLEHRDKKDPENVIGKVVYAKKIYGKSDCEDDRQILFWNQLKLPYIYVRCRLYDGAGHLKAQAVAAQIRDAIASEERPIGRFSVEGSTLKREGNKLVSTVLRALSYTIVPCNRSANSGLLSDPNAPKGFDQEPAKKEEIGREYLRNIIEARKSEDPNFFIKSGGEFGLEKGLEAGQYNVAPSSLVGGSALMVEDPLLRRQRLSNLTKRAAAAIRDWDKIEPIRPILKNRLPEADEGLLNHFESMADDYRFGPKIKNFLGKMEEIVENLGKSMGAGVVNFQDKEFRIGKATVGADRVPHVLLGHNHDSFFAVPESRFGAHQDSDIIKLPLANQNQTYRVRSIPREVQRTIQDPNVGLHHIYVVFNLTPHNQGVVSTLAAKYLVHDGAFHVLEDHAGIFQDIQDGPLTDLIRAYLDQLKCAKYLKVANLQDLIHGLHPGVFSRHIEPDVDAIQMTQDDPNRDPVRFELLEQGRDTEFANLEIRGDQVYLDGALLDDQQIQEIWGSLEQNAATIRHSGE